MRYFFLSLAFLIVLVVAIAGWRGHKFTQPPIEIFSDMVRQPKVLPQQPSAFFADGRAARPPVPGTVPLGYEPSRGKPSDLFFSTGTDYLNTGRIGSAWGEGMPFTIDQAIMLRGRERFTIFCAACHGLTGAGDSMSAKFGLGTIQSLLQPRIRTMPDGEIFHVISQGRNTMTALGDRIPVRDRWAIIAYLRALQKSQGGATLSEIPETERTRLGLPPP